jgi:cytochrome P450
MTVKIDHAISLSNLLDPEVRANPYPLYHQLRSTDPVYWDEAAGCWVLTGYADIVAVLRESRFSKAQGLKRIFNRFPETERVTARPVFRMFSKQMLFADAPYHTQLKGLVNKAFTPRVVERMQVHIQEIVDELLDAVQHKGQMDIIHDFAFPLPVTIIAELLGLPREEHDKFKKWSDDFLAVLGAGHHASGLMQKARQSIIQFSDYISTLQAQHHQHPKDDLLGRLFTVEEEGQRLDHKELVANSLLLLVAGHETTTNLIGNGLLALLRHPDQMKKLRDNPSLINTAVEELLRYDNPVQILWRYASEEIEIAGKQIGQGQMVNLIIAAANRDPAQFPDPDRLDLSRPESRHAGFGFGIHFCLGSALARLEGQIAINTLLQRIPTLKLETEALEWQENPIFRGLKSLPVVF